VFCGDLGGLAVLFSRAECGDMHLHVKLAKRRNVLASALGSFSTAYNVVNIR
jgi:hypothetical protein